MGSPGTTAGLGGTSVTLYCGRYEIDRLVRDIAFDRAYFHNRLSVLKWR